MKFYGTPNMLINVKNPGKRIKHLRFDENGELECDNPRLINRLKAKFKYEDDTMVSKKDEKPTEPNLESLKRNELISLLKVKGFKYKVGMKNNEMIKILRGE